MHLGIVQVAAEGYPFIQRMRPDGHEQCTGPLGDIKALPSTIGNKVLRPIDEILLQVFRINLFRTCAGYTRTVQQKQGK